MRKDIGDRFQEETKYDPHDMGGHVPDWIKRPEPFKEYPDSVRSVQLPEIDLSRYNLSLAEALLKRRSRRAYRADRRLKLDDLSFLIWATQGVTARYGNTLFRTAPSAGALYPVETYIFVRAVESLKKGLWHYNVRRFELELVRDDISEDELAQAALMQSMVQKAQVVFLWTAVVNRSKWKYLERAYRYIYLDAGHICQNLYLAAEVCGLGCCGIGAFFDDWLNRLLGVDGTDETIIYMATIGVPKTTELS
ncbi:MAG: SagB/ThcOx family dehydrogenase [Nitrospirae bacterium]|nr:SagB/ThcOx family dehydrogenase [Nitrospirota bacterium]